MPPISEEAAIVLRALKAATGTLSREQLSAATGIDVWTVDEILVSLQIHGLAQCVALPSRPRDRPRNKPVLWTATRPDLA